MLSKKVMVFSWAVAFLLLHGNTLFSQGELEIQPLDYFRRHAVDLQLVPEDIEELTITGQHRSALSGITHVYLQQHYQGIEVSPGVASLHYNPDGTVLHLNNELVPNLAQRIHTRKPDVSTSKTLEKIAILLELPWLEKPNKLESVRSADQSMVFSGGNLSTKNIPIRLVYQQDKEQGLRLSWEVEVNTSEGDAWVLWIDAANGTLLRRFNRMLKCQFGEHSAGQPVKKISYERGLNNQPIQTNGLRACLEAAFGNKKCQFFDETRHLFAAHTGGTGKKSNAACLPARRVARRPGRQVSAKKGHFLARKGASKQALKGAIEKQPLLSFNGLYNVFDLPIESPLFGSRTPETGTGLIDPISSPHGWHDNDGNAATIEYGYTRGNNVYAYYDALDMSNPGPVAITRIGGQYSGGNVPWPSNNSLNFNYQNNISSADATDFVEDAVTNLFVMNNIAHDVFFRYGFDEAAGNFQETNHSGNGIGGDFVLAETQDGGGTNDARFKTPPEGESPTMRMFLWNTDIPNSRPDGDFDNLIIVHEYGHGVSFRLIGGPANVTCLQNFEQGGEGWSDFFGLLFTMKDQNGNNTLEENVLGEGIRGIGNYVLANAANDTGLRPAYYSTNMDCTTPLCNDYTYGDLDGLRFPHGVGFLWCSMLWDMTWNLIGQYGFEPDIHNTASTAGNIRALKIVIEALKLTPCSPTFINMRDCILLANANLYGGQGEAEIWEAFSRRGLGFSAAAGGNEAFDGPFLRITKSVDKAEAENGETVAYTIDVKNNSDAPLNDVVISDVVAPGLQIVSISDNGSLTGSTITYPSISIPVGTTVTRTFTAKINTPTATTTLFEDPVEGVSPSFVPEPFWIVDGGNPNPGTGSNLSWWHLDDPVPIDDAFLVMNLILDGSKNNHLSFWQYYDLEFTFDGGVVEVLQGGTWQDLDDRIIKNGYNRFIHSILFTPAVGVPVSQNSLNDRRCFTGYSGGYINTIIDLSGFSGLTPIRFRISTNLGNTTTNCDNVQFAGCDGWYLDDFELLDLVNIKNTACVQTGQGLTECADVGRVGTVVLPGMVFPVELLSFTAEPLDNAIALRWQTATEQNNRGFELQRATNNSDWKPIAWMAGSGSTTENNFYQWTDNNVQPGIVYYYRLRQVDFDGAFIFSKVVSALLPPTEIKLSIAPNPAKDEVKLSLNTTNPPKVALSVFSSSGKWLKNIQWPENTKEVFWASNLPPGLYFLKGRAGNQLIYQKLIIQK